MEEAYESVSDGTYSVLEEYPCAGLTISPSLLEPVLVLYVEYIGTAIV